MCVCAVVPLSLAATGRAIAKDTWTEKVQRCVFRSSFFVAGDETDKLQKFFQIFSQDSALATTTATKATTLRRPWRRKSCEPSLRRLSAERGGVASFRFLRAPNKNGSAWAGCV